MANPGNALEAFYKNHLGLEAGAQKVQGLDVRKELQNLCSGITGGAEGIQSVGVLGGSELQDYANGQYSKAKEKLIRQIARDVFSTLKVKNSSVADNAPIEKVVEALAKLVPNPKKGKNFNSDFNKSSEKQREVCMALGSAINKNYGGMMINMSGSPREMCVQVAEVIHSLVTGLHTEFITVAGDVARTLRNMALVSQAIDSSYRKQMELVKDSGDSTNSQVSQQVEKIYKELKAEFDRQMAVLTNLMNVSVGPNAQSLVSSLEDNQDFAGLIRELSSVASADPGTKEFGDILGHLLSGVASTAHTADLVDKALKKIGMSVNEFKNAKDAADVRLKVYKHIMDANPSSKQLDEMMKAAELIYKNSYNHDSVAKLLSKKGGEDPRPDNVEHEESSGVVSDGEQVEQNAEQEVPDAEGAGEGGFTNIFGGDDEVSKLPKYWASKAIGPKIAKKRKYRDLLLKDFRKQLKDQYREIIRAAARISQYVGNEIPPSDSLKYFVDVFKQLPNLNEENLHIALSGYPKDAVSREKREKFMADYALIDDAVSPLVKGPHGADFKALQSAMHVLIKLIDDFSEKIVKAITEIHIDSPEQILKEFRATARTFYGSGDFDLKWTDFDRIKLEMSYYYSIADIKTNMLRSADENKSYAQDYENLLGEEAGWIINSMKNEFEALVNGSNPAAAAPVAAPAGTLGAVAAEVRASLTALPADDQQATYNNLKKVWDMQLNAKINMVKAAQAIDLYMKAFTDGIARNPDIIESVVKMLDQVEMVAKWFTDRAGDSLAYLFEVFPSKSVGAAAQLSFSDGSGNEIVGQDGKVKVPGDNYYSWLEGQVHAKNTIAGNPLLGRSLQANKDGKGATSNKQLDGIVSLTERSIKTMRALENIISTFFSVGSKMGNVDPAASTFMTAGQIYNALCDYIKASAFSTQFAPNNNLVVGATKLGRMSASQIMVAGVGDDISQDVKSMFPNLDQNTEQVAVNNAKQVGYPKNIPVAEVNAAAHGVVSGVTGDNGGKAGAPGDRANRLKFMSLGMASIPSDKGLNKWVYHAWEHRQVRLDSSGWNDVFFDTDLLFEMVVKSIVAKIFTVVDAYRLFHRPTIDRQNSYSLNPLRVILGGAQHVKVIPEAYELYYRLPLLAEWYRDKYSFRAEQPAGAPEWRLAIVPNVDGIWSDFISVMFDKAGTVSEGNYAESQAQEIIQAINVIYKAYKSRFPKSTSRNIINAFVLEINRIYGFMKQEEIKKYLDDRREFLKTPNYPGPEDEDFNNFDILNADEQFATKAAPSDRFVSATLRARTVERESMQKLQQEVDRIKREMDADFIKVSLSNDGQEIADVNITHTLRNYRKDLENAKNDEEQYKIVLQMIQGGSQKVSDHVEKIIMVHEMVAAPLSVLYSLFKVLNRYNCMIHGLSLANLTKLNDYLASLAGAARPADYQALRDAYVQALKQVYKNAQGDVTTWFANTLTGFPNVGGAAVAFGTQAGYLNIAGALGNKITRDQFQSEAYARDLIEMLIELTTNQAKMASMNVGLDGSVNLDISPLVDMCKLLMQQVKSNISKLRSTFQRNELKNLIDKYENKENVGSTRWLDENLVEILINDRDETGLNSGYQHLLSNIKQLSKPDNGAGAQPLALDVGFPPLTDVFLSMITCSARRRCMTDNWVLCNPSIFPFNVMAMRKALDTPEEKTVHAKLANNRSEIVALVANDVDRVNGLYMAPLVFYESFDTLNHMNIVAPGPSGAGVATTENGSLFTRLNKFLHLYVNYSLDEMQKTYAPLIEPFANSVASSEVMQGKAYPNVSTVVEVPANRTSYTAGNIGMISPETGSLIYASTALAIKNILYGMRDIGTVQKKRYLYESLAEMSETQKEKLRVNLPIFIKHFNYIVARADALKMLLSSSLKNNIDQIVAPNMQTVPRQIADPLFAQFQIASFFDPTARSQAEIQVYLNSTLTRLADIALSAKRCAENVYKELSDKLPYFMEPYKNFTAEYKARYGHMPLILPSHQMVLLASMHEAKDNTRLAANQLISNVLLPNAVVGSDVYQMNHGLRVLYNDPSSQFNIDHFPSAKDIYNGYNAYVDNSRKISANEFINTLKLMTNAVRFLVEGMVQSKLYARYASNQSNILAGAYRALNADRNAYDAPLAASQFAMATPFGFVRFDMNNSQMVALSSAPGAGKFANPEFNLGVYQLQNFARPLSSLVGLITNGNVKQSLNEVSKFSGHNLISVIDQNRARLRTLNILDMNIVPINVHAFMREIAFANIMNYSYTFDRMIHDFIQPKFVRDLVANGTLGSDNMMIKHDSNVNNIRELLVKLLCHPYAHMNKNSGEYYALMASLFNGNDDLKLGRPRYLSDQLWHKALLTSSIQLANGAVMGFDQNFGANANPQVFEAQRAVVRFDPPAQNVAMNVVRANIGHLLDNTVSNRVDDTINNPSVVLVHFDNIPPTINGANDAERCQVVSKYLVMASRIKNLIDGQPIQDILIEQPAVGAVQPHQVVSDDQKGSYQAMVKYFKNHAAEINKCAEIARRIHDTADVNAGGLANDKFNNLIKLSMLISLTPPAVNAVDPAFDALFNNTGISKDRTEANYNVVPDGNTFKLVQDNAAGDSRIGMLGRFVLSLVRDQLISKEAACLIYARVAMAGLPPAVLRATMDRHTLILRAFYVSSFGNNYTDINPTVNANPAGSRISAINPGPNHLGNAAYGAITQQARAVAILLGLALCLPKNAINQLYEDQSRANSSAAIMASDPVLTRGLKIYDVKQAQKWVEASANPLPPGQVVYAAELGKVRFDTKLVRNLTWIVQLQRIMRVVLIKHLSYLNTPLVRGMQIADPTLTEYDNNDQYDNKDFTGEKYSGL